jgi:hypothetical protein
MDGEDIKAIVAALERIAESLEIIVDEGITVWGGEQIQEN